MYKRILVPVDMEHLDKLQDSLDISAKMARENDAGVVYVGVVDAVPTTSPVTVGEKLKSSLDRFAEEQAKEHEIETSGHIALRGDLHVNVGSDIVAAAKETDCDLIVMSSHVPGIKDHFFSSNAGYVASHAPVSVYVVR